MSTNKNIRQTNNIKQPAENFGQPPGKKAYNNQKSRIVKSGVHDNTANHTVVPTEQLSENSLGYTDEQLSENSPGYTDGLSQAQQQFVLKFCHQLASVIEACEQSESAEIEVGRRQINSSQIKVKLQAEREFIHL